MKITVVKLHKKSTEERRIFDSSEDFIYSQHCLWHLLSREAASATVSMFWRFNKILHLETTLGVDVFLRSAGGDWHVLLIIVFTDRQAAGSSAGWQQTCINCMLTPHMRTQQQPHGCLTKNLSLYCIMFCYVVISYDRQCVSHCTTLRHNYKYNKWFYRDSRAVTTISQRFSSLIIYTCITAAKIVGSTAHYSDFPEWCHSLSLTSTVRLLPDNNFFNYGGIFPWRIHRSVSLCTLSGHV